MCPIINPQVVFSFVFFFLVFVWAIGIPVYLISRIEKIVKLLENKDQK
ncbi:MAG: hypothetical protein HQL21_07340 [Candidatus Omnitrophica bacterium]|nr:hypothetical protein [Candidatus Omnitrophota bacterium]